MSLDLSIAEELSPFSGDHSGHAGMGPENARSGTVPEPSEGGARSSAGSLVEFRRTEGEFDDFFDDVFEQLRSLSMELAGRQRGLDLDARRQAEESDAVAECRRQFRLSLDEFQQVQAEAREFREETRRVLAEVRAAQEQSLRLYAAMHEAQAALSEDLGCVESIFLLTSSGPSCEGPAADNAAADNGHTR